MAETKYTYSVQDDTANGEVNADKLTLELGSSSITIALSYIGVFGDILDIWFKDSLSEAQQAILGSLVEMHDGVASPTNDNPPSTADGDWHVVNENFAHVTGNQGINWVVEKYLEAGVSYSEKYRLENGRHATINALSVGAAGVPSEVKLEWYVETYEDSGVFMRYNPWTKCRSSYCDLIEGSHDIGDTVLDVQNTDGYLENMETDLYYEFENPDGTFFYDKITAVSVENEQVTIANAAPIALVADAMITGKDRPIGRVGTQYAYSKVDWASPPNGFLGNGKNYFLITIKNTHTDESALVSSSTNGWHTSTESGD